MNNKNIKFLCGTRAVPGKPGTKGMKTEDIRKFIETRAPPTIKKKFDLLQQKDKTRAGLCAFLSTFQEGVKLLHNSAPSKPTKSENSMKIYKNVKKNFNRKNVPFVEENIVFGENLNVGAAVNATNTFGNNNNNKNLNFGNANIATYIRPSQKQNVDPLATGKLSGRMQARVRAALMKLKRAGKLPNIKSNRNAALLVFTSKPGNISKINRKYSYEGNINRLKLNKINNKITKRIPTRSNIVLPNNKPKLSRSQIDKINKIMNLMYFNNDPNYNINRRKMINNARGDLQPRVRMNKTPRVQVPLFFNYHRNSTVFNKNTPRGRILNKLASMGKNSNKVDFLNSSKPIRITKKVKNMLPNFMRNTKTYGEVNTNTVVPIVLAPNRANNVNTSDAYAKMLQILKNKNNNKKPSKHIKPVKRQREIRAKLVKNATNLWSKLGVTRNFNRASNNKLKELIAKAKTKLNKK